MVSEKTFFMFFFPNICLCKTCDPLGPGHFWPQGHNLNKLGRGLLGILVSEKIFHVLPLSAFVKHVTPGAGPFLVPGA